MKERKEKVLQNAKDSKIGKANAPAALQASIRANRASKDTQNITNTDNATTGDDNVDNATTGDDNIDNAATGDHNTDNAATGDGNMNNTVTGKAGIVHIPLPPHSSGKAKHPSQIKTSSKHITTIAEPSTGDPLPDGQATVKASGHTLDLSDVCICEFLIQGTPNPHDLDGIEEDQLLEIQ